MDMQEQDRPLAFVLMPFDPEFEDIYSQLIVPALDDEGYEVRRADTRANQQNVMRDVIVGIDSAALIVADLTGANPNVFYELGIAHGLMKPTVLLAQSIDEMPFDLRSYRIIRYSVRFAEATRLRADLADVARGLQNGTLTFGSPVSDFAPSVIERHGSSTITLVSMPQRGMVQSQADGDEDQEEGQPGILDFQVDVEGAAATITEWIERLGELTGRMEQGLQARSADFTAAQESVAHGSAAKMQTIANTLAVELIQYSQRVEANLPEVRERWNTLVDSTTALFSAVDFSSETDRAAARELLVTLEQTRGQMDEFHQSVVFARDSISQLRKGSRSLDRAGARVFGALDGVADILSTGEAYIVRIMSALDERLDIEDEER